MLIHSAVITGSVQLNNTDVSSITNVAGFATTASVDSLVVKTGSYATTSSVNELQSKTGSYATTSSVNDLQSVTGSYATTSSFGAYTSSNDSTNTTQNTRLSTIESVTGSYATTGSNQFNGNQSISGSITSNGTITAQTLVVQTVTSSIEFVTGSTRNGSLSSNTHEFTGSVLMSSSLGIGTSSPNFNSYGTALTLLSSLNYGGIEVYGSGSTKGGQIDFGSGTTRYASISGEYESADNGFIQVRTRRSGTMTDAIRITSDGRVAILATAGTISGYGTTVQSLMVNGGSGDGAITINASTTGYAYMNFAQNNASKFEIGIVGSSGNGSFYINRNIQTGETGASIYIKKSDGFVGINNITPGFNLDVSGDIRSGRLRNIGSLVLNTYATVNPSSNVFLYSTPNDRDMWIMLDSADTTSNWGIYYRQIDTAVGSLPANSVAYIGGGNSGLRAFINLTNGDYYFGGSNLSDARSKHNINYISYSAIDKVKALKPATFYYNENPDISKGGFIAQDVKEILPEFITNKDDEKHMMGVDYYGIIAVLTKAIQELSTKNTQLEEILQRNNIQ